jgi:hypothetical protein
MVAVVFFQTRLLFAQLESLFFFVDMCLEEMCLERSTENKSESNKKAKWGVVYKIAFLKLGIFWRYPTVFLIWVI